MEFQSKVQSTYRPENILLADLQNKFSKKTLEDILLKTLFNFSSKDVNLKTLMICSTIRNSLN